MAKEIPYFKFYIVDWLNGDITLESYELQGLFISLCAYYWSKDGSLTLLNAKKKFRQSDDLIEQLIQSKCIKIKGENIKINFLDEQLNSKEVMKAINRANGSLGGRPKKAEQKRTESEKKPDGLFSENPNETYKKKIKVNNSKVNNKEKELFPDATQSGSIYKSCIDLYNQFIISRTGAGAKINAASGSAMKKIIQYLNTQVKDKTDLDNAVPNALAYVFTNYDKWEKFHQSQINLNQIESNLINILNSIRNGNKPVTSSKPQSKYAPK